MRQKLLKGNPNAEECVEEDSGGNCASYVLDSVDIRTDVLLEFKAVMVLPEITVITVTVITLVVHLVGMVITLK